MGQYERLIRMAEDELTEYSTQARKVEKLRRKIGLSVSRAEQEQVRQQVQAEMGGGLQRLIEQQRQTVALPFWGIAGLGLLQGILDQPLGWVGVAVGLAGAIGIQKWGWSLQARQLLLDTFDEIEKNLAKSP